MHDHASVGPRSRAYEARDEETLARIAAWLRLLAADYEQRAAWKFEHMARWVERHNAYMARNRARAIPSKAPPRATIDRATSVARADEMLPERKALK